MVSRTEDFDCVLVWTRVFSQFHQTPCQCLRVLSHINAFMRLCQYKSLLDLSLIFFFFFLNTSGFNEGIPLLCLAEQNRGVENHSRTQKRLLTHEMEQHSDTEEVHVFV